MILRSIIAYDGEESKANMEKRKYEYIYRVLGYVGNKVKYSYLQATDDTTALKEALKIVDVFVSINKVSKVKV